MDKANWIPDFANWNNSSSTIATVVGTIASSFPGWIDNITDWSNSSSDHITESETIAPSFPAWIDNITDWSNFSSNNITDNDTIVSSFPARIGNITALGNSSSDNFTDIETTASSLTAYKIGIIIHVYLPMVILPLGIVGNILSFLVMVQSQNRGRSTCIYMAALALSDTLNLVVLAIYWIAYFLADEAIGVEGGRIRCKVFTMLAHYAAEMGAFIVMSMTVDRFIAVRYPLKAVVLCSPYRAKVFITCGAILLIIFNVPVLWMADLVNEKICANFHTKDTFTVIYAWLYTSFGSILPCVVLLGCNAMIISSIHRRRSRATDLLVLGRKSRREEERRAQESQLTLLLLLVTFVFLLLTLPIYARYIVYTFVPYRTTPHAYARYVFFYHLTNKLWFTNRQVKLSCHNRIA